MVLPFRYGDSERIFFLISEMRKGNKEKKKSLILAGKIKSKKIRGMKMRIITCFKGTVDLQECLPENRSYVHR